MYDYLVQRLTPQDSQADELSLIRGFAQQQQQSLDLLDPMALFRAHFCVRHYLYVLQQQWRQQGVAELVLGLVRIERWPAKDPNPNDQGLSQVDALAHYYLDADNLTRETDDSVRKLLDAFFRQWQSSDPNARQQALAALDLDAKADAQQIRQRYRQLASQHHPDKGGCQRQFHRIRHAYELLMR